MNMTTSVNWTRPAVGIVRVEQELFKALHAVLGDCLTPCVLSDGKLVAYSGSIGTIERFSHAEADAFVWPDPSYEFPQTTSLDPVKISPISMRKPVRTIRSASRQQEIEFDDVLISVGLDWDWERAGLDTILYKLKTEKGVKVITCCYDLIPVLFPQYCVGDVAAKFREYFTNLTWASSGMLCISRRSEADYRLLAEELGMPRIPTKVMLLGNKLPEAGDDVSDQVASICESPFILFVGTIERRKNHEVLYKALRILAEGGRLDPELKLVFVGMPGWGVSDLLKDLELDPMVSEHIVQLSHANDAELRRLYETCTFFAYPSFYEGWGLPVAEALAFGKFVIASDRGSIPEVGGDLVEYVDPWNATAWADAIEKYWTNRIFLESRADRIRREYHPIHWEETASAVLELIDLVSADRISRFALDPGYDLSGVVGLHYGSRILAVGRGGILCHGPYRPLPKGGVRIDMEIEKLNDEVISLEFRFTSDGGARLIHREVRAVRNSLSRVEFQLDLNRAVEDFEIVIGCPEGSELSINEVNMQIRSELTEEKLVQAQV
jgi:glycosyltransferase involved in cell wall biosynthesis